MQETHNMKNDTPLELTLILPEADIKGLHFNKTEVKAFFEQKDDGSYYSRDVLFYSARRTEEKGTEDVLTEYLETIEFRTAIFDALPQALKPAAASCIKAFIPEKEDGRVDGYERKYYNGAGNRYWLRQPDDTIPYDFCIVVGSCLGLYTASWVCGCAPAFRIEDQH
ncbi:MAG: hypothetical protein Ta2A_12800 [Treponemataceae bacterium]|nr:MAG: hypothetical protein Ta2A_12800 [Treponemataceae bacterium]